MVVICLHDNHDESVHDYDSIRKVQSGTISEELNELLVKPLHASSLLANMVGKSGKATSGMRTVVYRRKFISQERTGIIKVGVNGDDETDESWCYRWTLRYRLCTSSPEGKQPTAFRVAACFPPAPEGTVTSPDSDPGIAHQSHIHFHRNNYWQGKAIAKIPNATIRQNRGRPWDASCRVTLDIVTQGQPDTHEDQRSRDLNTEDEPEDC